MRRRPLLLYLAVLSAPTSLAAQEAGGADVSAEPLATLLVILAGLIATLFGAAGFAMIEAGLVRAKNAASSCLKALGAMAVAGLAAWLVGAELASSVEKGGFLGEFRLWSPADEEGSAAAATGAVWLYYAALFGMTPMIVAGCVAERTRLGPFLLFAAMLSGLIAPIAAGWVWGGGYLAEDWRFSDVAGATVIHSVGGWAALAGALVVGPRRGKFAQGRVTSTPGGALPLAGVGAILLWAGLIAVAVGADLALSTPGDAVAAGRIAANVHVAGCGGALAAIVAAGFSYRKIDLALVLNGGLGGLIAIAAEPLTPAVWQAAIIGAFAGVITTAGAALLERVRIDDVVGAIPRHLFCGVWGSLAASWTNEEASVLGQAIGVAVVAIFSFGVSALVWTALRYSVGVRPDAEREAAGLDLSETGREAFPGLRIG